MNPDGSYNLGIDTSKAGIPTDDELGITADAGDDLGAGGGLMSAFMARGGKVPAMVSPGERYLPPAEAKAVKEGKKDPMKAGEKIPGKPKYPGNNYANDVVPKTLEEGGLVIPNSVMQSKHPGWAARKFVDAHMMANGGMIPKKPKGK
jgi:hypothetical protein